MFPVTWFTQPIRINHTRLAAVGQVKIEHVSGNILWILNMFHENKMVVSEILDCLTIEAGLRKLHFLRASLSKNSPMFETFIKCGYKPSGRETIWRFKGKQNKVISNNFFWRKTKASDSIYINLLQNKMISLDEKRSVPLEIPKRPSYVLFQKGILYGYAYVQTSGNKAVITPILDPQIPESANEINSLCRNFLNKISDHYIVLTASQQWVQRFLQGQIEMVRPRQELLIKQVAIRNTAKKSIFKHVHNGQRPDIATPLRQSNKQKNNI